MAKKWSNKNLPGALHFVTGSVQDRKKIFTSELPCRIFLREFQNLKATMPFRLIAFVLMPDHFHFVINPLDGNIREWTGALKSLTAKSLIKILPKPGEMHQVWQESFKSLPLWSSWMAWQKINYIHSNPVRAGLVRSTADYRWSSFNSFYEKETDPLLRVDKEWSWPDDVQKLSKAMDEWNSEGIQGK